MKTKALFKQVVKEGPFRASDKGGTLTKDPLTGLSNRPKWSSDSDTFWSLSRRLLRVERRACTFFQPFHAIHERGSISKHILIDINEIVLALTFFEKNQGSDALKGLSLNDIEITQHSHFCRIFQILQNCGAVAPKN